jgi:hypothetical protein
MLEPVEDLDRLEAFTYLTVPERSTYLAIMRLFTGSLMTDLSAQHVADALDLSPDTAVSRLNYLVTWGNLLPSSHTVRVKSIEEYQRARSRYQLSPLGERVQRQADEVLSSADAAREISRELLGLLAGGLAKLTEHHLDAGTAREVTTTLFAQFWDFRNSVRDFYAYLGQVLARYDLDSAEYTGFKDLLLDYVESITEEIVLLGPRIERHLEVIWPDLAELLRKHLGIDQDPSCFNEFVFRSQRHPRYSDNALTRLRDAAVSLDMDAVWKAHNPSSRRPAPCALPGCQAGRAAK